MSTEQYFSGEKLYGDDFTLEQIKAWFEDEKEGYASLGYEQKDYYAYSFHLLNNRYGYAHLPPQIRFNHVMGIGSATGEEFFPLKDRIGDLLILEPSDQLPAKDIYGIPFRYQKPDVSGIIDAPSNYYDLITCFGVLHHIPNVSTVMGELIRCLAPGGYLLVREPINSMGDWRYPRPGLTKRERGIPLQIFRALIAHHGLTIVRETLFYTQFVMRMNRFYKLGGHTQGWVLSVDRFLSILFTGLYTYHRRSILDKLAPTNVYYVLQKPNA